MIVWSVIVSLLGSCVKLVPSQYFSWEMLICFFEFIEFFKFNPFNNFVLWHVCSSTSLNWKGSQKYDTCYQLYETISMFNILLSLVLWDSSFPFKLEFIHSSLDWNKLELMVVSCGGKQSSLLGIEGCDLPQKLDHLGSFGSVFLVLASINPSFCFVRFNFFIGKAEIVACLA